MIDAESVFALSLFAVPLLAGVEPVVLNATTSRANLLATFPAGGLEHLYSLIIAQTQELHERITMDFR